MSEEFKEGYRQGYRDGYQDGKDDLKIDSIPYNDNITDNISNEPTVSEEWLKQNIRRCSACQATIMSNIHCGKSYCPQDPFYYLV